MKNYLLNFFYFSSFHLLKKEHFHIQLVLLRKGIENTDRALKPQPFGKIII